MDLHQLEHIDVSLSLVLAIMATLGYVFGTLPHRRRSGAHEALLRLEKDLSRAKTAVHELQKVVRLVRSNSAKHYSRLKKFQIRLARLGTQDNDLVWHDLCREVESILGPTLQLVSEISNAQERIRYQSNYLLSFSEVLTDPLTGLGNRRALEHALCTQLGLMNNFGTPFTLAVVDVDHFKDLNDHNGHQYGDKILRELADLLKGTLRTMDILTRYGGDELVVVMPQTDMTGAKIVCERLRTKAEQQMPLTVSVGMALAGAADTVESLFNRADAALYAAKKCGRNRMCEDPGVLGANALVPTDTALNCHVEA